MEKFKDRISRTFYFDDTVQIAKNLLGKILVHESSEGLVSGFITETEAYNGVTDPACHSFKHRKTRRNEMMYAAGGTAYVYLIYGMYYCFNVVTGSESEPKAVLIRSIKPIDGIELMVKRRKLVIAHTKDFIKLCNGPGKLSQAMGINANHNGADLCQSNLYLVQPLHPKNLEIHETTRININYAGDAKNYPWRFYIKNSTFISKK